MSGTPSALLLLFPPAVFSAKAGGGRGALVACRGDFASDTTRPCLPAPAGFSEQSQSSRSFWSSCKLQQQQQHGGQLIEPAAAATKAAAATDTSISTNFAHSWGTNQTEVPAHCVRGELGGVTSAPLCIVVSDSRHPDCSRCRWYIGLGVRNSEWRSR
jgi:hypothetical protein